MSTYKKGIDCTYAIVNCYSYRPPDTDERVVYGLHLLSYHENKDWLIRSYFAQSYENDILKIHMHVKKVASEDALALYSSIVNERDIIVTDPFEVLSPYEDISLTMPVKRYNLDKGTLYFITSTALEHDDIFKNIFGVFKHLYNESSHQLLLKYIPEGDKMKVTEYDTDRGSKGKRSETIMNWSVLNNIILTRASDFSKVLNKHLTNY